MTDSQQSSNLNTVNIIIGFLKSNSRLAKVPMDESSHFDRDLNLSNAEVKKLLIDLENHYHFRITSNVTVFARQVSQLAFYIESQVKENK